MTVLVIGRDFGPTRQLRAALGADRLLAVPEVEDAGGTRRDGWPTTLERWEQQSEDLGDFSSVVIACWDEIDAPSPFVEVDGTAWSSQLEQRLTTWAVATKVGIARCADGGAVVVVVERPAAFDAVGRSMLVGVAEGVLGLMRCVAVSEGPRAVRVNAVTTELWTAPEELLGPTPALASFPGRVDVEVAGAIRLLLSEDAAGVTGSVVSSDGGRAV
jgi:NAD(P)-dependent dehydrogenase (short-subunit alcohol dehydrogenase family)